MIDRFEQLTTGIAQIYKCIQRIKKHKMNSFGLKGTQVMCIHYLDLYPDGLTAADLCRICKEDKAGISRILSDLENLGFISYGVDPDRKKYRAKAVLTEAGKKQAEQIQELILLATSEGGNGISDEEREIFYRVLFQISDNLTRICKNLN